MPSDKLITLVQQLDVYEKKRLRKFICSPYYNESEDLLNLYDYISPIIEAAALDDKSDIQCIDTLRKEEVWHALFGDKAYKDASIRKLCSNLIQLIFRFLAVEKLTEEQVAEEVYMAYGLNNIKLEKHFKGVIKKSKQRLEKQPIRNTDYHMYCFLLRTQEHRHSEKRGDRSNDLAYLKKADHHLDCYYLSKKLMHLCDALYYKRNFNTEVDLTTIPQLIMYIEDNNFNDYISVRAYYLALNMITSESTIVGQENYYYKLKELWSTSYHCFNQEEQRSIFVHLVNHCISNKLNMGETSYSEELFSLYKTGVEKRIIFENDVLPIRSYKNIVGIGLKNRAYTWVKNFIENNTQHLEPSERAEARAYNEARLYYEQSAFDIALEKLRRVEFKKLTYALGGKALMVRIFYEEGDWSPLESLLSSFRVYLLRNENLSQRNKRYYLNTLRFVKKLMNAIPGDRAQAQKIRQQIEECQNIAAKEWLLEKAEKLKLRK